MEWYYSHHKRNEEILEFQMNSNELLRNFSNIKDQFIRSQVTSKMDYNPPILKTKILLLEHYTEKAYLLPNSLACTFPLCDRGELSVIKTSIPGCFLHSRSILSTLRGLFFIHQYISSLLILTDGSTIWEIAHLSFNKPQQGYATGWKKKISE